ncbi:MAG: hypothetical protein RIT45_1478 [Pseudomonadota bacterium]
MDRLRTSSSLLGLLVALALVAACSETPSTNNGAGAGGLDTGALFDTAVGDGNASDGLGNGNGDGLGEGDTGDTGEADSDEGDADAGAPDTGTGDDATAGPVGDFGKPCKADGDCESGYCVQGYNGFVCTQTCDGGAACPAGHACSKVKLGDGSFAFLCLAEVSKLCHPCKGDIDCSGGRCVEQGGEKFCAPSCGAGLPECPGSHSCDSVTPTEGEAAQTLCMPKSGSCNCSAASVGVVRACAQSAGPLTCYGVEICEASGWSGCQLQAEVCDGKDNDCNGQVDEGFVDAKGAYTTAKACGACGNDCSFQSFPNATPVCDATGTPAKCAMQCDAGTYDVDDNPKTGCECVFDGNTDLPDGKDHNCDGIDGEKNNGVFVAKTGKKGAAGSFEAPVASVQDGIDLAKQLGKRDVYVATGVYDESIVLTAGVSVYGGYSANFAFHDADAYETVLVAADPTAVAPGAVNAVGITGKTTIVDGLVVYAANVKATGASTYGLYLRDCDGALQISDSRVIAGDAGNGESGDPGSNGSSGTAGSPGTDAKDLTGKTACDPGSDQTVGGKGGSKTCGGKDVSGGKGGTAICPAYNTPAKPPLTAENGTTGTSGGSGNGNGGNGGTAGLDGTIGATGNCNVCSPPKDSGGAFLSSIGLPGKDGANGPAGALGGGCSIAQGSVVAGLWKPATASDGSDGGHGGGGGGGGAGGGVDVTATCTKNNGSGGFRYPDVGGSGGGGGSGGCGGNGGQAGSSGGASFAAFVIFAKTPATLPTLTGNTFVTGNGGEGGQGGQGGVGGLGGDGKDGGGDDPKKLAWCAGTGGRGGQGGDGGHGGGGGGGCGGASYGLFSAGADGKDLGAWKSGNDVVLYGKAGKGGAGGKSLGKDGGAGSNGAAGQTNF